MLRILRSSRPTSAAAALWGPALAAGFALVSASAAASPVVRRQGLVPANFSYKTDALGFLWDIDQQGRVSNGTSNCFNGGLLLSVNGNHFTSQRPMMTPSGNELVLAATTGGLEVTRRILVDVKAGGVRYVELFRNPGRSAVNASVMLQSNLGGTCQSVITSAGTPFAGGLGPKETGLVAVQHAGHHRPSVVWNLAGVKGKTRPTVNVQSNYRFQFTYSLQVPPGKAVGILHSVAQRRFQGVPDPKTLASLFKAFNSRAWTRGLPADVRRAVVNVGGFSLSGVRTLGIVEVLESLGVSRGSTDVLAIGEETRLAGSFAAESIEVETRYGPVAVPLDKVVAVTGPRRGRAGVYLRDGRAFTGEVDIRGLRFTMSTGLTMDLDPAKLEIMATRVLADDGKPDPGAYAFLDTADGDRLALCYDGPTAGGAPGATAGTTAAAPDADGGSGAKPLAPTVTVATPWGERALRLDEIRAIRLPEEPIPGHVVSLKDGSRFYGFLGGEGLRARTLSFGEQTFEPAEIRSLTGIERAGRTADGDEERVTRPHAVLAGSNLLVGYVDLGEVHIVAAGESVPVPPNQVRSLHNLSADEGDGASLPTFHAELWGGGTVAGELGEAVLPLRSGEWVCEVPVADIVDVFVPTPSVPDALRDRTARLIRRLGHPDWETREEASRELAALGYMARRGLEEALKQSADPEVQRRVKALLDQMPAPTGAGP